MQNNAETLGDTLTCETGNDYLMTPANIVPNGPPHLGHIGGPLLRMDILRRHLSRLGANARLITTTDVYETHVSVKALELDLTSQETAHKFHVQIAADMKDLQIDYDILIDIQDPDWAAKYTTATTQLVDALQQAGTSKVLDESLPIRTDNKEYVLGGWLAGNCPNCKTEVVSFFCENCGDQITPSDLLSPRHRLEDVELSWIDDQSLFMVLPDDKPIRDKLESAWVRPELKEIADRYLDQNGPKFRLSLPSDWGEACVHPGLPGGHVTFCYSLAWLASQILCGEAYKDFCNTPENPFSKGSSVTIVTSFGIDNTVPMLVGVLGLGVAQGTFKAADFYLGNHFYTLGKEKFSTNRLHAIWATEICAKTTIPTDVFRAHMVRSNPEYGVEDFDIQTFLDCTNRMVHLVNAGLDGLFDDADDLNVAEMPKHLSKRLNALINQQRAAMDLRDFCLKNMMSPIDRWLEVKPALCGTSVNAQYWWAKGLALLSYPVMPSFATWLWQSLGHLGDPTGVAFATKTTVLALDAPNPIRNTLDYDSLAVILPESLRK